MEKMKNKIAAFCLVGIMMFMSAGIGLHHGSKVSYENPVAPWEAINENLGKMIPFSKKFEQMKIQMKYATGQSLQDEVFISDKGLMVNPVVEDEEIRRRNTNRVIEFFDTVHDERFYGKEISVYFSIIPTSTAILQENLPYFSDTINQRNIIDNVYNQIAGHGGTINVYNTLLENRYDYIYNRTDDSLTALGGYYIYQEQVRRMLMEGDIKPLNLFNVSYIDNFYGNTYDRVPYNGVKADILSFYHYTENVNYFITYLDNKQYKQHNTLYPKKENGMKKYLGGCTEHLNIRTSPVTERKLLIVGDTTAVSYLPFLANHYSEIDFINVNSAFDYKKVDYTDYDQILVAVGIENFINSRDVASALTQLGG